MWDTATYATVNQIAGQEDTGATYVTCLIPHHWSTNTADATMDLAWHPKSLLGNNRERKRGQAVVPKIYPKIIWCTDAENTGVALMCTKDSTFATVCARLEIGQPMLLCPFRCLAPRSKYLRPRVLRTGK